MSKIKPFEEHREKYENWFVVNSDKFTAEVTAIQSLLPSNGIGFEVGVGSGLFAEQLNIKYGIDPSYNMLKLANERGIKTSLGVAENLPIKNSCFDFILVVTAICFVDNILESLKEMKRVIKNSGSVIIGFVDKNSKIGKKYLENRDKSLFYNDAIFYSTDEIIKILKELNFKNIKIKQTLIDNNNEYIKDGYGEGSFVVIKAEK